jgi:hypothetical protein
MSPNEPPDEEEEIDEEQLADYCAMLDKLGNFPVSLCGSRQLLTFLLITIVVMLLCALS